MNESMFDDLKVGRCVELDMDIDELEGTDMKLIACRTDENTVKMKGESMVDGQKVSKHFLTVHHRKMNEDDF